MPRPPTAEELATLEWALAELGKLHKRKPITVAHVMKVLGQDTKSAIRFLGVLERAGWLIRSGGRARETHALESNMKLTNPYSADGSFSAAEKLAALEREVARSKGYHQGLVDAKRMKPENFASKIGALEAIVEDLRAQMVTEAFHGCQWAETGNASGVIECATCKESYRYKLEARPSCPKARTA